MGVYTIEADGRTFDIESDTAPTEAELNQIVSSLQGGSFGSLGGVEPVQKKRTSEDMQWGSDEWKKAKTEEMNKEMSEGFWGTLDNIMSFGYNLGNEVFAGIPEWLLSKAAGKETAKQVHDFANAPERRWVAKGGAEIASYIVPVGAAHGALKIGGKLGAKWAAKASTKGGKWLAKATANAVAMETENELQHLVQANAGTREYKEGETAMMNLAGNTAWNVAAQGALSTLGAAGKAIGGVISRSRKAVKAMGGIGNLDIAREKTAEMLKRAPDATSEEATALFIANIAEGLGDKEKVIFQRLIQSSPEFAKFVREQMVQSKGMVTNTINAITNADYKKMSRKMLSFLYENPNYRNAIGATDADFSAAGLKRLLGTDNASKALEERSKALARAERQLMANPDLATDAKREFNSLTRNMWRDGRGEYNKAVQKVERGTLSSYAGSKAEADAMEAIAQKIEAETQRLGRPPERALVEKWEADLHSAYAKEHFDRVMAEGPNTVTEMNEIKEFFREAEKRAVKEGEGSAIGAFHKGINQRIFNKLDPVLFESGQALIYEDELLAMHGFAHEYTRGAETTLKSLLENGTSAMEKNAKLTAFKMGYMDRMTQTALDGDRVAFNDLVDMAKNKKNLGQFFDEGEINDFMKGLKPKVETMNTLKGMIESSEIAAQNPDLVAPMIRAGVGAATGSRNTLSNAIITFSTKAQFGPGTAKAVMEYMQNPTAKNLNRVFSTVVDALERTRLKRTIVEALADDALRDQMIIRTMHNR